MKYLSLIIIFCACSRTYKNDCTFDIFIKKNGKLFTGNIRDEYSNSEYKEIFVKNGILDSVLIYIENQLEVKELYSCTLINNNQLLYTVDKVKWFEKNKNQKIDHIFILSKQKLTKYQLIFALKNNAFIIENAQDTLTVGNFRFIEESIDSCRYGITEIYKKDLIEHSYR